MTGSEGGVAIVVDARALGDASSYRGIGSYLRGLLPPLVALPGVRVTALASPMTALPVGVGRHEVRRRAPGRFATLEHDLRLPIDLRGVEGDVVHSPALDPPRRCAIPWVQTLHDVIPLTSDAPELARERRRWHRYAPRYRRAAAVIAVSTFSAEQGIVALGLDPARVHVIHHGVSGAFGPDGDDDRSDVPYVLSVGEYSPRKGFAEAFALIGVLADAGLPHRLRVVGRIAPWVADEVDGLVAASPRPDRIDLLGYVSEDRLAGLYRGADVVAVTSRSEGFGLPAAEAMASGAPVVAFSNTSITEIVGGGGTLVEDGDVAAFAREVQGLVTNAQRRAEAVERALLRARAFSWRASASAHAEVFRVVKAGAG